MASCKYYDAGWCYAPKVINANDVEGACTEPEYCPYLKSKMTEKEKIEGEIKILQKKLSFLEEIEKTKSPVEEAYKDWWGEYPGTENWTSDATRWQGFQAGYEFAYAISTAKEVMEKVQEEQEEDEWKSVALCFGEKLASIGPYGYYDFTPGEWLEWVLNAYEKLSDDYLKLLEKERVKAKKSQEQVNKLQEKDWNVDVKTNLKPQTPEEIEQSLKEAFCEAIKQGIIPEVDKQENDKNFKNSLDLIKGWNDYQWNKCLKIIREKLR